MGETDWQREIESLQRQIKNLSEENEILTERTEDIYLLGIISEKIGLEPDRETVIATALESLSTLKDLAYCAFFSVHDDSIEIVDDFEASLVVSMKGMSFPLSDTVKGELEHGVHFSVIPKGGPVPEFIPSSVLEPNSYCMFPVIIRGEMYGILCVNNIADSGYLNGLIPLLERICDVLRSRLETLSLIDEIQKLNVTLESKVDERTSELRLSEERYHRLFDSGNDAVFVHHLLDDGTLGKFIEVNDIACRRLGYSREELLEMTPAEIDVPEKAEIVPEILEKLSSEGHVLFEMSHLTREGREIPVEVNAHLFRLKGKPTVLSIARDISERKLAEERLKKSEQSLKTILESVPYGVMIVGRDKTIRYINRSALAMTQFESEDMLLGRTCYRILCQAEADKCPILDLGQELDRAERKILTKDGKQIPILKSVVPISLDGEAVLLEAFVDITKRKEAEEFIRDILESVDEGIVVIDPEYRISTANKAFCGKAGKVFEEISGRHCYEASHGSDTPCYLAGEECPVKHTFETGEPYSVVHTHDHERNHPVYLEIKSYPMKNSLGEVVSVIELIDDITERKKLEAQLRQSQKMEAVGTLTGGIAHDFNNMLTAIMGFGEFLQDEMDEKDPLRAYVDNILASSEMAANLTQSLLAFSRKQETNPVPVSLNEIVAGFQEILSRLIGEDIELKIVPADEEIIILADRAQIEQVLMNLATNARDAMPEGGSIVISTGLMEFNEEYIKVLGYGKPGLYCLLSFGDTGVGMDEETRERIFEPFFTTKALGRGTGIGLSVVYGIVQQHNGHINVYSEPGKGTTFKIYLPVIKTVTEKITKEAPEPEGGTETVLVVEDDERIRALLQEILERFGYTVLEAVDGEDAVKVFGENKDIIELVLCDVVMPKMDGRKAYEEINKIVPGIKVLFLSGYTEDIIQTKGISEDFDFVSKPIFPKDLLRKVRAVLDKD